MHAAALSQSAQAALRRLCVEIDSRRVGSPGNRAATDFFASQMAARGFAIETAEFACMDWVQEGASLSVERAAFQAFPSPYAPGCRVEAPLAAVSTVEALEAAPVSQAVLLLHGEIAKEQLMPKNFTFYNPESHQRILRALEARAPRAIITATGRDPGMAGALYPFPLIEDGDFDIPSVYMTTEEGARLAALAGRQVALESRARRIPSTACNVYACKGDLSAGRVTFFAHIDAKPGAPGAIDNAAGVTVLLLLGELLQDYAGRLGIEIVALNGEDYYANPGEMQYLRRNAGRFGEIRLGINLDGLGFIRGRTAYSLYGCPPAVEAAIQAALADYPGLAAGEAWYQGDHTLFVINQTPALALTSELVGELLAEYVHTAQDTPQIVDPARLAEAALALRDVLLRLEALPA
jgi:aminopeptidase YwaD